MAIKRYVAIADTTITNAFKSDLTTRGTGSNMGASDILECFAIYAQASSSSGLSSEVARALIKFDTAQVASDRTAGVIPASGSVSWYLKLYNAPHSQGTPHHMFVETHALATAWDEGRGLDMEDYGYDGYANWVVAKSGSSGIGTVATATITAVAEASIVDTKDFTLTDTAGTTTTYNLSTGTATGGNTAAYTPGTTVTVGLVGTTSAADVAAQIIARINAGTSIGFSASADAGDITVTQNTPGVSGNRTNTDEGTGLTVGNFTGGDGTAEWTAQGGDWVAANDNGKYGQLTASFDSGIEDIEIDISDLVEVGWLAGGITNNGIMVKMPAHTETAKSSSYTKRFFGRESHFFYRRPQIEARWDSSVKDDRSNFYLSSSLASSENINNLYLYNYIRGQMKSIDIPAGKSLIVKIYSGSSGPSGDALKIKNINNSSQYSVSANESTTGVYKVQLQCTSSIKTTESLYDVWLFGSDGAWEEVHTGSAISPKKFDSGWAYTADPTIDYVINCVNLKSEYSRNEKSRFRFFARKKNWQPTVYTKATSTLPSEVMESGSYNIKRVVDDLDVIPYGTGSLAHTLMSYDSSGSFFDLDMSLFEPGYSYYIRLAYYNGSIGDWIELNNKFKFRVEE